LTGAARLAVTETFAPYEVFLTAGAIYFSITTTISWALRRLESRLGTDKLQTVEKGALRAAEMVHA
jgi:ABC-type arginine/histidine transport system permease subunit